MEGGEREILNLLFRALLQKDFFIIWGQCAHGTGRFHGLHLMLRSTIAFYTGSTWWQQTLEMPETILLPQEELKVKNDHRSKFSKQLERRSLKKNVRASTGFEPVTSALLVRCSTN